ncbi:MAG: hypothetical protein JM58_11550 [Peptococcaceae bacterium BICA1-8]|nr:MAG: hypothetical protein JM58_11550 [Peptococcaceae bacterium BICA1-8]
MKKLQILSTTPIASIGARFAVLFGAILTIYYRQPLPFFLLILYLSYLLCSYYWTRMSCRSTVGNGTALQQGVFAGETFNWEFGFSNQGFFPLVRCGIYFFIAQQFGFSSNLPLSSSLISGNEELTPSSQEIYPSWNSCTLSYAWLPEKNEVNVALDIQAQLRGIYYFPPVHFFVGDPSGLFRSMNQISQEQYLFVFPHLRSTEGILKILTFEENHREDSFGLEDRYQLQGVRDYQQSDSPKSINWYATARGGSLKTNIYQRTSSEYCLVVLDLCVRSQPIYGLDYARLEDPLLEEAISLAAGIALYHLEQGAKTAFYTNAPLLKWEKKDDFSKDSTRAYMKKVRKITTLGFAQGEKQGQNILKLCASIDETSRAHFEEQEKLWAKVKDAPANTSIYLLGYHNPPASWYKIRDYNSDNASLNSANFYTSQKLGSLSSSKVRLLNLS